MHTILGKLNQIEGVDFSSIEYYPEGNACLGVTTNLSFEELGPKVVKVLEDNCELLRREASSMRKMEANPNLLKDCHYRHYAIYPLLDNFSLDNAEVLSKGSFYIPAKYASYEILTENAVIADLTVKNGCPDCKDGFYYPLIGSPEPCLTCNDDPDIKGTDSAQLIPSDIVPIMNFSHHMISTASEFDRQCRTAFNEMMGKDFLLILYSAEKLRPITIELYSQHSREIRIALLISNIKHFCHEEVACNGVKWFDVNIEESKFFELWDMDRTAWKTGVHLKMMPNYGV